MTPSSGTSLTVGLAYTPTDELSQVTHSTGQLGGSGSDTTQYGYDAAERLTSLVTKSASGSTLASYTSTYDAADRVKTETDDGTSHTYSYDAAGQLLADGSASYSYDADGNRTMAGYQAGTGNQLRSDGTWNYTYDAEGNRTKKVNIQTGETWTYGYDNANHLVWAEDRSSDGGTLLKRVTYSYDALGDRIEEDVTTGGTTTVTRFATDGTNVWADLTGTNAVTTAYLLGDAVDQVLAQVPVSGPRHGS